MRRKVLLPAFAGEVVSLTLTGCGSSKLEKEDLKEGTGPAAKSGDWIEVHYIGTFPDGKKFDSSYERNEPYPFRLGREQVIKGWDEGLVGMKAGGKRKLTIPPNLAYGSKGYPPNIPPNATLIFEVEMLSINKTP
jgi:peptidylprolyl isomerase/FKBP-type peptidyl-prolyl cis-trans isomerase FkpA